jgi:hypothetical protein
MVQSGKGFIQSKSTGTMVIVQSGKGFIQSKSTGTMVIAQSGKGFIQSVKVHWDYGDSTIR